MEKVWPALRVNFFPPLMDTFITTLIKLKPTNVYFEDQTRHLNWHKFLIMKIGVPNFMEKMKQLCL